MTDHLASQPASTTIGHPAVVIAAPEPTPTPWDYVPSTEHHGPYITSNHGGTIADLYVMTHPGEPSTRNGGPSKPVSFFHEMADPNAALIVKAVNAHAFLVKALEEIQAYSSDPVAVNGAREALAQIQSV